MGNGHESLSVNGNAAYLVTQLLISSKQDCSGSVSNPNNPGWVIDFQVTADGIMLIDIPREQAYVELSEYSRPVNKGVFVQTTAPVSVYCVNAAGNSFDASYVLPIQALADDYIVQTYEVLNSSSTACTSAFLVVATEEGETEVDITPSVLTMNGNPANSTFSVTLQKGQVYQVRSHRQSQSRDLSGSRVKAQECKKIAVFNGNNLAYVPTDGDERDCIFEQAMPLQAWGKNFVVTASLDRHDNDRVKITSASDNNEIKINGLPYYTLAAGQTVEFELLRTDKSCFIQASHSCAVYLYNHSADNNVYGGKGAPSMVWISPIEQRIEELTFSTFNDENPNHVSVDKHYVNIIVESTDVGNVNLDGTVIDPQQFEAVNGTNAYMFYRTEIEHGVHHLSCPNGFNAHVYGFGTHTGYAYMAGSKAAPLATSILIDDIVVQEGDTVTNCSLDPIVFRAEVNYNNYDVIWDFGDNTTSNQETVQHSYADNGLYTVTLTVRSQETSCIQSTELVTTFYIDTRGEEDEEYSDDACIGSLYSKHGFDYILIERDTILDRVKNSDINLPENCQGHVTVHITAHEPVPNEPHEEFICFTGPDTFESFGLSISYNGPGYYEASSLPAPNEFGCDTITELHLTVGNVTDHAPDTVNECHEYTWPISGKIYYESQTIDTTISDPESGCYEIWHLILNITHAPDSCIVRAIGNTTAPWVVPGNEFQINAYEFTISNTHDSDYNKYDSVGWQLCKRDATTGAFVESGLNWRLVTTGAKYDTCKVYVFNHTDDIVWLCATAFNDCAKEGVLHGYWLKCSFYDIGENGMDNAGFSIAPNPNNGLMELRFEKMTGTIGVKVYDSRGVLIDKIAATHPNMTYDMTRHPAGIYFFIATSREGSIARKVVVTK